MEASSFDLQSHFSADFTKSNDKLNNNNTTNLGQSLFKRDFKKMSFFFAGYYEKHSSAFFKGLINKCNGILAKSKKVNFEEETALPPKTFIAVGCHLHRSR